VRCPVLFLTPPPPLTFTIPLPAHFFQVPIRQLHQVKQENPDLDIHQYLQQLSGAFRRFVLDTLTKLDEQAQGEGGLGQIGGGGAYAHIHPNRSIYTYVIIYIGIYIHVFMYTCTLPSMCRSCSAPSSQRPGDTHAQAHPINERNRYSCVRKIIHMYVYIHTNVINENI
jgi:hypothetical protein